MQAVTVCISKMRTVLCSSLLLFVVLCSSLLVFVIIQGVEGGNVALHKPARGSGVYSVYPRPASIGVDGVKTGYWPATVHTAVGMSFAWWRVDLQQTVHDAEVKIYFRKDNKVRRNGLRIYTSPYDVPDSYLQTCEAPCCKLKGLELCDLITGRPDGTDIPDVYSRHCPGRWRNLVIYTNVNNDGHGALVDFAEVEVIV